MAEQLLRFQDFKLGLQKVFLNTPLLYPNREEHEEFEERLGQFLDSDRHNCRIFEQKGELLIYQTECIIPEKRDSRTPLLLLLGNPASHSVSSGMFFSFERTGRDKREHRLWKILKEAGLLSFRFGFKADDVVECNQLRKKELYNLSYKSPFCIGLATFYSMPSGAGGKWAGVRGLQRLFRKTALARIAEIERTRVEDLIRKFVSPKGLVVAFQKDAYEQIKSSDSPEYSLIEAKAGNLKGLCQCNHNVGLLGFPPTRLMQENLRLLRSLTS